MGVACHLVVRLIAGRLVSSDGRCTGKRCVGRGNSTSFFFGGIGNKNFQGQGLQAREYRAPNRPQAGFCSLDSDWLGGPVVHRLVTLWGLWLRKTKGTKTCLPRRGHCTIMEEAMGDRESQMLYFLCLTALVTDRKKSRQSVMRGSASS